MAAMDGCPVVIRLLDPPLHEFVPQRSRPSSKQLAKDLNISMDELAKRAENLHESNPMMGHRGVRLGVTYPEVTEMQVRAIFEAAAELIKEGKKPYPEIMIPVVCDVNELKDQFAIVKQVYAEVLAKYGIKKITPHDRHDDRNPAGGPGRRQDRRAGRVLQLRHQRPDADGLRLSAATTSAVSCRITSTRSILPGDPFQSIDQSGVGELIQVGIERGRKTKQDLEVGICGEHGGEPASVEFCHRVGMNYVTCSPFRVPIARLAAAQAVVKNQPAKKGKKK